MHEVCSLIILNLMTLSSEGYKQTRCNSVQVLYVDLEYGAVWELSSEFRLYLEAAVWIFSSLQTNRIAKKQNSFSITTRALKLKLE